MITKEQIKLLHGKRVPAILLHNYRPSLLDYGLSKGTLVEILIYRLTAGVLYVARKRVDDHFPYDAAELLENE